VRLPSRPAPLTTTAHGLKPLGNKGDNWARKFCGSPHTEADAASVIQVDLQQSGWFGVADRPASRTVMGGVPAVGDSRDAMARYAKYVRIAPSDEGRTHSADPTMDGTRHHQHDHALCPSIHGSGSDLIRVLDSSPVVSPWQIHKK